MLLSAAAVDGQIQMLGTRVHIWVRVSDKWTQENHLLSLLLSLIGIKVFIVWVALNSTYYSTHYSTRVNSLPSPKRTNCLYSEMYMNKMI